MKTILFILIGVIGALGTFLSTISEHTLRTNQAGSSRGSWYKTVLFLRKTVVKVIVIFITTAFVLYITIIRDGIVESEATAELDRRDSITRKKYQEDREKSDKTIAQILAGNYLKLDTAQRKIVSLIKDSVNKKVTYRSGIKPQLLLLASQDTAKSTFDLNVSVSSQAANAKNVKLLIWISSLEGKRFTPVYLRDESLYEISVLPLNSTTTHTFKFENTFNTQQFIILYEGSYQDQDDNIYPVKLMYSYNIKEKTYGEVKIKFFDRVYTSMKLNKSVIINF
ncbi:hypothetical protein SAMN04488511_12314 [Pedobacter suwonensis]|uniref:Uncharacterized protein n=1 Tax=Pedobacter suwonensis TaxID=332999 RepID=A0A1I0U6C7_9SPHI|nr:hypothetical protein [Pedobacter suwonensis]SFA59652.1 hypothetical protein SAMN04488511_12314 [Pedobacter suwonensis]